MSWLEPWAWERKGEGHQAELLPQLLRLGSPAGKDAPHVALPPPLAPALCLSAHCSQVTHTALLVPRPPRAGVAPILQGRGLGPEGTPRAPTLE